MRDRHLFVAGKNIAQLLGSPYYEGESNENLKYVFIS